MKCLLVRLLIVRLEGVVSSLTWCRVVMIILFLFIILGFRHILIRIRPIWYIWLKLFNVGSVISELEEVYALENYNCNLYHKNITNKNKQITNKKEKKNLA